MKACERCKTTARPVELVEIDGGEAVLCEPCAQIVAPHLYATRDDYDAMRGPGGPFA